MRNPSLNKHSSKQADLHALINSRVHPVQIFTGLLFAIVLFATPLARPPELPNPEIPIQLHSVSPIPILRSRLPGLASSTSPATALAQAIDSNSVSLAFDPTNPLITAQTAYALDVNSMAILFERNPDFVVSPASTTKLMTALVALDLYPLDEIVTVKSGAGLNGASAGLFYGEELTVEALLQATLIHSANDAAWTLAEHHPEGVTGFVALMNEKARNLHLANTVFKNPVGYDHPEHVSTARDLALLAHAALKHEFVAETVAIQSLVVSDTTGRVSHRLATTNELLKSDPSIRGVKTGTTEQAGQVLITLAVRNEHPVLLVLLGSQDRYRDTTDLLSWVYDSYTWLDIDDLRAQRGLLSTSQ
jgi:D-alanyl-D-alanine carboxypeptidase